MNEISQTVAFWILEAWRRLGSQLHTAHLNPAGRAEGSSGCITRTDEPGGRVSMQSSDRPMGQNKEWTISLAGSRFFFEPGSDDRGLLRVELSNGNGILFVCGESTSRAVSEHAAD